MEKEAKELLDKEVKRILKSMEGNLSGDERANAIDDLASMMNIINADRKSEAELIRAQTEAEKEQRRNELEKEQLKLDKRKIAVDVTKTLVSGALVSALPCVLALCDHKGWFYSKSAISAAQRIKL